MERIIGNKIRKEKQMIIELKKDVTKGKTEEELTKIIIEILKGNLSYPGIIIHNENKEIINSRPKIIKNDDIDIRVEILKIKYEIKEVKRTLASMEFTQKYGSLKKNL